MQTRKRIAAVTAITVGACAAGAVSAQDQSQNVQEVIVTGSRIRNGNINVETPTPVTTLSADELRATGATSLGDVLSDLPALRSTFTTANSSRFIGTAGVNFLDLR